VTGENIVLQNYDAAMGSKVHDMGGKIFHRLEISISQAATTLEHGLGFADDDDDNTVTAQTKDGQVITKKLASDTGDTEKNPHEANTDKFKINGGVDDDDDDEEEEEEVEKEGQGQGQGQGQRKEKQKGKSVAPEDDAFEGDDNVLVAVVGHAHSAAEAEAEQPDSEPTAGTRVDIKAGVGEGNGGEKGEKEVEKHVDTGDAAKPTSWWDTLSISSWTTSNSAADTSHNTGNAGDSGEKKDDDTEADDAVSKSIVERDENGKVVRIIDVKNKKSISASKTASSSGDTASSDIGVKAQDPSIQAPKLDENGTHQIPNNGKLKEKKGALMCNGKSVDSEVIYWREVAGDKEFESPISPHHANHEDRYITYEYDQGGWNNVRMSMECLIVLAHATGRTVVVPPQQNLYLLGSKHKDPEDKKPHAQMGFEDFFDLDLLYSHKGFHIMHMEDFLAKEGVSGGLHGKLPPKNSTKAWGQGLWKYLDDVADFHPEWMGKFLALPGVSKGSDFDLSEHTDPLLQKRMEEFGGGRSRVFYDEAMQKVHHIHFPADHSHRILQHFYAFVFFANPAMQSFYKRFIRDYMRYKDPIQCAGNELLKLVREDAKAANPSDNGDFYAIHARRGDFQFKEGKSNITCLISNVQSYILQAGYVLTIAS